MQLQVSEVVERATHIKSFVLRDPQGRALPSYAAGAHINIALRLPDETAATRSYSLTNPPPAGVCLAYEIGVLRQSEGRGGSIFMHDVLRHGDLVEVSEPVNGFALHDEGRRHTLIAGGIGITPIVCMARALSERGEVATVHYFGRSTESIAYVDALSALSSVELHLHIGLDVPGTRLALHAAIGLAQDGHHAYVCGPGGLIQSVVEIANDTGWPAQRVHYELFGGQVVGLNNRPFTVELARQGRRIEVASDTSLLDALCAQGVDVASDCRSGICGACLTVVLDGAIEHRDSVLTEDDRREGVLMCACVSRAGAGSILVLDL